MGVEWNRILVATDFSEASYPAVDMAFRLASGSQATLYLLHVVDVEVGMDPNVGAVDMAMERLMDSARKSLDEIVSQRMPEAGAVEPVVRIGAPASSISELAREVDADLIVVGTHGRKGIRRLLMGSTAENLLRDAPCQVLVVKQGER